ncbi:hypothetical protein [Pontibacter populi]|uniref:DUF5017 domain-containing protein n=1 Tax=Pontibacter populi TaxID=890055 RepID=A0ABV1RQN6_9BACT
MKKIFYLLSSLMLVFTACDPMEDVYEELDKAKKDDAAFAIELNKDDYAVYKSNTEYPHIATGQYLTGEEEAALVIPAMLSKRYAHLGNGATVEVNYHIQKFPGVTNSVSSWEAYTVTAEDYTAVGEKFANFNSSSDVYRLLDHKYPTPTDKQLVVLTYDMYAGGTTSTITDSYFFVNGDWSNIYHVTAQDYASVKNTYGSFSGSDDANLKVFFDKFLKSDVIVAKEGDFRYVSYYYYNSNGDKSRTQRIMAMYFDGENWMPAVGVKQTATLKFQKKDNVWVPDLSIPYTLVASDYTYVGNDDNNIATAAARANLRQFGNFSTYNWTNDQLYEAMGAILKLHFSGEEAGKKFKVTFDSYPAGKMTLVLVKAENGNFVKFEE